MKLNPYIQKLSNSQEYKSFQKKNSDAFLVAGFFVLDLETGQRLNQLDYYVPSKKKVAAFSLDKTITFQMLGLLGSKVPDKLVDKTKIDLDALQGILEDEMKNRSITEEIRKIIAVVQSIDGKTIWNLNCILSGMSILNAHVDDDSETILKMERKSLMDIARTVPASELKKQMNIPESTEGTADGKSQNILEKMPVGNAGLEESGDATPNKSALESYSKAEALERIKKLDMLESTIKEEKEFLIKSSKQKVSEKKAANKKANSQKK